MGLTTGQSIGSIVMESVLPHDAPQDGHSTHVTVQIVDDHALVREALAGLFNATATLRVVALSATIEEAVTSATLHNPHVVLLDLVMPERSIFAGIKSIATASPRSKIVLLDEFIHDHNLRQALKIRAAGYITKSITFQFLEESLRRAVDGQQVFMPEVFSQLTSTSRGWQLISSPTDKPLANLTERETEVLSYLAQGYTVKRVAEVLNISSSTVDNHKQRMMKKLRVHKTVDLTRIAIRAGLLPG